MKTNISVIAETTRPLSTGEFPLAIRLHKDNRRRYVRLGISLTPKYWDEKKGKIKSNCPNLDYYNNIVSKKIDLFQKQVWEFQNLNKPYTLDQLIESVEQPITKTTIEGYLKETAVV